MGRKPEDMITVKLSEDLRAEFDNFLTKNSMKNVSDNIGLSEDQVDNLRKVIENKITSSTSLTEIAKCQDFLYLLNTGAGPVKPLENALSYVHEKEIERAIELLKLCQQLQTDKDGVNRPEPGVVDKTKNLDQFAQDIMQSIAYVATLNKLLPMSADLARLGRRLEQEEKISLNVGDDYSRAALNYLLSQYGLENKNN